MLSTADCQFGNRIMQVIRRSDVYNINIRILDQILISFIGQGYVPSPGDLFRQVQVDVCHSYYVADSNSAQSLNMSRANKTGSNNACFNSLLFHADHLFTMYFCVICFHT